MADDVNKKGSLDSLVNEVIAGSSRQSLPESIFEKSFVAKTLKEIVLEGKEASAKAQSQTIAARLHSPKGTLADVNALNAANITAADLTKKYLQTKNIREAHELSRLQERTFIETRAESIQRRINGISRSDIAQSAGAEAYASVGGYQGARSEIQGISAKRKELVSEAQRLSRINEPESRERHKGVLEELHGLEVKEAILQTGISQASKRRQLPNQVVEDIGARYKSKTERMEWGEAVSAKEQAGSGGRSLIDLQNEEKKVLQELIEVQQKAATEQTTLAGISEDTASKLQILDKVAEGLAQDIEASTSRKKKEEAKVSSRNEIAQAISQGLRAMGGFVGAVGVQMPLTQTMLASQSAQQAKSLYDMRQAALGGDVHSMLALGAIRNNRDVAGRSTRANQGISSGLGVLGSIVSGAAKIAGGIGISGTGVGAVAGAGMVAGGGGDILGALTEVIGLSNGVTLNRAQLTQQNANISLATSKTAITGAMAQSGFDYGQSMRRALLQMGGREQAGFLQSVNNNQSVDNATKLGLNVKDQMVLSEMGAAQQGSVFNVSGINQAATYEQQGRATKEDTMARQALFAEAGAQNPTQSIDNLMQSAMTKSLNNAKTLNVIAQSTSSLARSSTGGGIGLDVTGQFQSMLLNMVGGSSNPNKERATEISAAAIQNANKSITDTSLTWSNVWESYRMGGAGKGNMLSGIRAKMEDPAQTQKLLELARAANAAGAGSGAMNTAKMAFAGAGRALDIMLPNGMMDTASLEKQLADKSVQALAAMNKGKILFQDKETRVFLPELVKRTQSGGDLAGLGESGIMAALGFSDNIKDKQFYNKVSTANLGGNPAQALGYALTLAGAKLGKDAPNETPTTPQIQQDLQRISEAQAREFNANVKTVMTNVDGLSTAIATFRKEIELQNGSFDAQEFAESSTRAIEDFSKSAKAFSGGLDDLTGGLGSVKAKMYEIMGIKQDDKAATAPSYNNEDRSKKLGSGRAFK